MSPVELPELSDDALLRRFVFDGSSEAMDRLRARYVRLVYSACFREALNASLAEDASQAVFLLLIRKSRSLVGEPSLAGWLFRASQLATKNLLRADRRRQIREETAMRNRPVADDLWPSIEPHLHAAMNELKPVDREAVLLRFFQEMPHAQVATALGVSEDAARVRVNRALEKMCGSLKRRGVVVAVGMLVLLLERNVVLAAPASLDSIPTDVAPSLRRHLWRLSLLDLAASPLFVPFTAAMAIGVLAVGGPLWESYGKPSPLSSKERAALFAKVSGEWKGTLEYADDGDGARHRFPTKVSVSNSGGNSLRWIARYSGATNVDETTFEWNGANSKFRVQNGGPQSSHPLNGDYDLMRLPDGQPAFIGFSPAVRAEVRLILSASGANVRLREENRDRPDVPWRFRNQFDLTR